LLDAAVYMITAILIYLGACALRLLVFVCLQEVTNMNPYYVTLDVDGKFRGHHVVAPSYDLASQWAEEWVRKMDEDAVSVVVRVIQRLYTSRSMLPAEGGQ
jgi:hypothetical protein